MENNEQIEETQESSTEDVNIEETNESAEDTKDWKAEALKFKAIAERKEKKLQETESKTDEVINKPNTEQSGYSPEETIYFAGEKVSIEELRQINEVAEVKKISRLEAYKLPLTQTLIKDMRQEAQVKANQLGASGGSPSAQGHKEKPLSKMTREEHVDYAKKRIDGLMG